MIRENYPPHSFSFTQKYIGLANQLLTECFVSRAFNPSLVNKNLPERRPYLALWDTGATNTSINKRIADELGILPTGMAKCFHANGSSFVNTYEVNLFLPNNLMIPSLTVSEGQLAGFDILIGMDVIHHGDFSITCKNGNTVFSFQLPSTRELDFVEEYNHETMILHTPIIKDKLPGRNESCHCGSGKKYKNCHGK